MNAQQAFRDVSYRQFGRSELDRQLMAAIYVLERMISGIGAVYAKRPDP